MTVVSIGYLNINSLPNKITDVRIIFKDFLSETKLDESFPAATFTLEGYKIRSRKHTGDLIQFVKNGFICKTIPEYTSDKTECICSELNISKSNWILLQYIQATCI